MLGQKMNRRKASKDIYYNYFYTLLCIEKMDRWTDEKQKKVNPEKIS